MPVASDGYLTDRELAVLELVADGRTNAEIAETLVVAQGTVRTHVAHIFDKLQVRGRRRLGRLLRRLQSATPDIVAVLESRQPVPKDLSARFEAFLSDARPS